MRRASITRRFLAVALISAFLLVSTASLGEASWFLSRLRAEVAQPEQQERTPNVTRYGSWALRLLMQGLEQPCPVEEPDPSRPGEPGNDESEPGTPDPGDSQPPSDSGPVEPDPVDPEPDPEPSDPEPADPEPGEEEDEPEYILGREVPAGLPEAESAMLQMVNSERVERGLPALQHDPFLTKLARIKSQDMVDNGYFAHTSPTLGSPFEMMRDAGVSFRTAAENLSSAGNVHVSHYRLMHSSGHRRNILHTSFTHVGIGIVRNRSGVMVTQLFVVR